jgi:hypothetical protein
MMNSSPQARVFISCGPQKTTDEIDVAHKIGEKLRDKGFEPYIGQEDGTLKGLKENTLKRLGESEYLILVHFKNERVYKPREDGTLLDTGKHRGSILSHEVFAASASRNVEFILLEDQGIKEEERISRLVEVDRIEFTDKHVIPDLVAEKVEEKKWTPKWRNELTLETDKKDIEDTPHIRMEEKSFRYYYVRAKNLHHDKIAYQCAAYLEKVKILSTGEEREFDLMEFKLKGITTERVVIPAMRERAFDAFRVRYDSPSTAYFGINQLIMDYTGYLLKYSLAGPGDFEVTFILVSENFPPVRETFKLHIGTKLEDIEFVNASREEASP